MGDEDGPKIANRFYSRLFRSNVSVHTNAAAYTTETARALHIAVNELRSSFARWVTFIHLGI
jgi:hypothetical protein